jgi:branched-chain amino acid transport system ATP-binding protein
VSGAAGELQSGTPHGARNQAGTGPGAALVQVQGLSCAYGSSRVLFDLDFSIQPGETLGLLGRNGMGKTTLIRALTGLKSSQAKTIVFDGTSIQGRSADWIARLGVGLVPEGRQVFTNLTVHEHLAAFATVRNGSAQPWSPQRVYELFPRLAERRRNLAAQLSGGEQQMLAIGRALVTNPKLLILDEATEGLAPLIREEIWRCLTTLRKAGQTLVVVDKYVNRLIEIADRHLILERGRIAWQGSSPELAADRSLWHRYLGV